MSSPENLDHSQRRLLELWLNQIDSQSVKPTLNPNRAVDLFQQAKTKGQTLSFIAIGCADWQDWSTNQEKIWHVGKINSTNKRARRFTEEVAQWQNSLLSLGVKSVVNFSLSNVEILDPSGQNLDSRLDDPEMAAANIQSSNEEMITMLRSAGANVRHFDHFAIWQKFAPPTQATTGIDFLTNLISFDFQVTAPLTVQTNEIGPIWLDIQTFSFKEIANLFRHIADSVAPSMPLLTPFKNSGNWHAKPEAKNSFPNALQLMTSQFQFKPAESPSEWREKSLKLPDSLILAALRSLGITELTIDNDWNKRKQAIEILSLIAFNN